MGREVMTCMPARWTNLAIAPELALAAAAAVAGAEVEERSDLPMDRLRKPAMGPTLAYSALELDSCSRRRRTPCHWSYVPCPLGLAS